MPSEEKIQALVDTVKSKFDFIETIKIAATSLLDIIKGIGIVPSISINLPETKYTPAFTSVVDFSWFEPYKNYTDLIITGFVYVMFLWRLIIRLPDIISGSGGFIHDTESIRNDIDKLTDGGRKFWL